MKILLLNGSPREKECTYTALSEVATELEKHGAKAEILQIGNKPLQGCIACRACQKLDRCTFGGDIVNVFLEKAKTADGFIFGSPVYFANPNGSMLAVMDRIFFSGKRWLSAKPAAAVVSARRAGTTSALDSLQKFFQITGMPMVPATYWPMVFGYKPTEVQEDKEGLQNLRELARQMIWMITATKAAKDAGLVPPEREEKIWTNFMR
ncbi:MAG: flavodoxin family protein [Clostridiales Family XIII bacterium]|jgi:multimeric flavodoxin WrbA|nr:flavodoxin family protein [Clostridiales Family XIII bacterium]